MRLFGLAAGLLIAGVLPVAAAPSANVDFSGTVAATCSITASTNGTMKLNPSTGTTLGSEEAGGTRGSVTVLSIGASTLTIGAPTLTSTPPVGYVTGTQTIEVSYSGAPSSGLSGVSHAYTSSQTTQPLGTIGASDLYINNRIVNPSGFPPDTYTTRTVVTCAQP
jgi:hypothetical protein